MMERAPRILVADRDLSWSRDARGELRRRGAVVVMSTSVDDALHQSALDPPDLVVLDDELDGREGRNLAEIFGSALPDARIILLQSSDRLAPAGVFASGPRPISCETLVGLAEGALGVRLREKGPKARRPTVMCVDDDPAYLRSISRLLSRRGYEVSAFDDADRALEAVSWLNPDVALVDIMMPGMGGLDLGRKIREASDDRVSVVFLTALDSDEAYYEGHQHGGRYMVEKTETPQKVLDVVDFLAGDLDPEEREVLRAKL
jgi:DNA-binding response OmpR family regulator